MEIKNYICLTITVLLAMAMFFAGRGCRGEVGVETRVDTLFVRDTVRDTVPALQIRHIVRTDTVFVKVAGDTVRLCAEIPVERRVYLTDDYRAVVEGFRPSLIEMEIYRRTRYITKETGFRSELSPRCPPADRRRWGIGIQAGYGLTPTGPTPYIGLGVQYNIVTW